MNYRENLEKHLGRKLTKQEKVHHIDGNDLNNNLDNLQIVTNSQHKKIHDNISRNWEKELYDVLLKEKDNDLKKAILSLSYFFTFRQRQIIYKKFKKEALSKTEKEYYSRTIKKKLTGLANTNLHNQAIKLIYGF